MRPAHSTDEPPFADLAAAPAVTLPRPDSSIPLLSDEERAEFASLADAFSPPEPPSILTGSPADITTDFLLTDPITTPPAILPEAPPTLPDPPAAPVSISPTPVIPEPVAQPIAQPPPTSPALNPDFAALLHATALADSDPSSPQPDPSPIAPPATPTQELPPAASSTPAKPILPATRAFDPDADVEHPALILGNLAARLAAPVHTFSPAQPPPPPPQSDSPPLTEPFPPSAFFDPSPEDDADDHWTSLSALLKSNTHPDPELEPQDHAVSAATSDSPIAPTTTPASELPEEPKPFLPPIVTRAVAAAASAADPPPQRKTPLPPS